MGWRWRFHFNATAPTVAARLAASTTGHSLWHLRRWWRLGALGSNVGPPVSNLSPGQQNAFDLVGGWASNLTSMLVVALCAFTLSPILFNGSALAFQSYAGASASDGAALLRLGVYENNLAWTFDWPLLDYDITLLYPPAKPAAMLQEVREFLADRAKSFNPSDFLEAARASNALTLVLIFTQTLISAIDWVLETMKDKQEDEYPTIDLALVSLTGSAYSGSRQWAETCHETNALLTLVNAA